MIIQATGEVRFPVSLHGRHPHLPLALGKCATYFRNGQPYVRCSVANYCTLEFICLGCTDFDIGASTIWALVSITPESLAHRFKMLHCREHLDCENPNHLPLLSPS